MFLQLNIGFLFLNLARKEETFAVSALPLARKEETETRSSSLET